MKLPTSLRNRYFVMRHGESQANAAGIIFSDPRQAIASCGLTPTGRSQAQASAASLQRDKPTIIVSSDFRRARETAEIAAGVFELGGVTLAMELRERFFGAWDGQPSAHYDDVWRLDARDSSQHENDVESVNAVADRLATLVSRLESEHARQRILLVAHGDPLQILQTLFESVPGSAHRTMPHLEVAEIRPLEQRSSAAMR